MSKLDAYKNPLRSGFQKADVEIECLQMKSNNSKNKADNIALWFVIGLTISFAVISAIYIWNTSKRNVLPENIVIELKSDTAKHITYADQKMIVDSLNMVMLSREKLLAVKYQDLIERRRFDDDVITYFSIIIGFVISILGFFGLKNFQSIKEESVKIAERKSKEYLELHLNKSVADLVHDEDYLNEISNSVTSSLRNSVLNDLHSEIETAKNVKQDIDDLSDRLDKIEKTQLILTYKSIIETENKGEKPEPEKETKIKNPLSNEHVDDADEGDTDPFNNYNLKA